MLNTSYENKEKIMIVRLNGELMLENVEQLKSEFEEHQATYKYFVFDFENVGMIDSSGLGYIVYCLKKLREKNGDVKITNLLNQAKLIFEITRVNSIVDIFDNEDDAISSILTMEKNHESNNSNANEVSA